VTNYRDPKNSEAQIKRFAWKVLRRFRAAGDHSHEIDDVVQELWIAWHKAVQAFNPEMGVPFGAYLMRGMKFHINKYADDHVTKRHDEVVALSMDMTFDEDKAFANIIPDTAELQDEVVIKRGLFERVVAELSPDAKTFVRIMTDDSEELRHEVRAIEERNNYASSQRVRSLLPLGLSETAVFELMGATYRQRERILAEIENVSQRYSK